LDIKERMQAVFQAEAAAINAIEVDADFIHAVEVMMACRGKILTTGIGKAGHIAKKFAATLCSTATPADFIHPAEAAHGDLGLVGSNDVMIAFFYQRQKPRGAGNFGDVSAFGRRQDHWRHISSGLGASQSQRPDFKYGSDYRAMPSWPDPQRVDGRDASHQ
jgi:hypothetical protein